jgi:hypothetical protein
VGVDYQPRRTLPTFRQFGRGVPNGIFALSPKNFVAFMTDILTRASRYVAAMPRAISGSHGHDATFAVASTLRHGFALPKALAWPIMLEFNQRCDPPWSEKELDHKLNDAARLNRDFKPRGHLLGKTAPKMQPVSNEPSCTVLDIDVSQPLPGKSRRASETISHPAAERPVEPSAPSFDELSESSWSGTSPTVA